MSATPSLATMLQQCEGLLGTKDINNFEEEFLSDNVERFNDAKSTTWMSEKQIAVLERLWRKHFA